VFTVLRRQDVLLYQPFYVAAFVKPC
jgi:hypothetical protein